MLKSCHMACLAMLVFTGWNLSAIEFERNFYFSVFLRKDGTCPQATFSGHNLHDRDLELLKHYALVESVSFCFGGTECPMTPEKLQAILTDVKAKELGLYHCENNFRFIPVAALTPTLTKLKVSVGKVDESLIQILAQAAERGKEVVLELHFQHMPDKSLLEELRQKLANFKKVDVNSIFGPEK